MVAPGQSNATSEFGGASALHAAETDSSCISQYHPLLSSAGSLLFSIMKLSALFPVHSY